MTDPNTGLSSCGCCAGVESLTPATITNRPGLSTLAWRVGTHGAFKVSLRAALARQAALRDLTTRDDQDPAMGLLDAWAATLDVLAFYQERIANEGFLRTATERRSLLELARSIGYELNPGVAASAWLAFTLETAEGSPAEVTLAEGTKVQSIPAQDEDAQIFETIEEIVARPEWNELLPRTSEMIYPYWGQTKVYLQGTATNLKAGDALLIVGAERESDPQSDHWDFRRVIAVEPVLPTQATIDPDEGYTEVTLEHGLGSLQPPHDPTAEEPKVYALRQRAALFGHNAPDWRAMPESLQVAFDPNASSGATATAETEWPHFNLAYAASVPDDIDTIDLDTVYSVIVKGSWIVLTRPGYRELYQVEAVSEASRTEFTLTGKVTRLELSGENLKEKFGAHLRSTVVFGQSEALTLAARPITTDVGGISIELASLADELPAGRLIVLSGEDSATGETASEVLTLDRAESVDDVTRLVFTTALTRSYRRETVTLNANVARATHGETKQNPARAFGGTSDEVLGSGDGAVAFQEFILSQAPLTYVSAATASGAANTLEIRVNGALWTEVATLYGRGPTERVYTTRRSDDGKVTVQFGDGVTGARLPSGSENVTARYRVGLGLAGHLAADQLTLLLSRPLGLKAATNPIAPSGGADPETEASARVNAPLTVLTLDRVVSLQDYEDFTRAFAGVAKALADLLWDGEQRLVHLTIAGEEGAAIAPESDTHKNLVAALDAARHAHHRVELSSFSPRPFSVAGQLKIDPTYVAADVLASAQEALVEAFSFDERHFGQGVAASDLIARLHEVNGVEGVVLTALHFSDRASTLEDALPANVARWSGAGRTLQAAELLTLDSAAINLTELTA